ncbi:phospho-2-dehydro-3-deoxyheptonate aldolase,Trp-sensitive [Parachlamydia acanthamoebae UV-7]|jgi:3-deoxy-7-phosphoheptulonate synthase|uniref:Phospho-2-dehydro-3-deoxyheptonate aldolase n=2 Tax=Parachlamydia acanthamoebae TaxID=83552 RepID=F8L1V8_PARAV|nr:3-deoxy-7-phosphoheptulonate synthase [Parachlamydia acanthamoebae]CCB87272.1 phospho-2-dehydro-3-deoxyheptonate aldolase,Trp-sensitive [Parachlamydia acanthamoebae UV-7]
MTLEASPKKHHSSLPTPQELIHKISPSSANVSFIETSRQQIRNILDGHDSRLLFIVGPCSIHDITAAKEYAIKLRHLSTILSDTFFVMMRVHFEKPRTAHGWKGFLYDPYLDGSNDIQNGFTLTRQLLLDLADLEMPVATEFLNPACAPYFEDLISWGCIGARTSASPIHRQLASSLPMPIAFKNSVDGNIEIAASGAAVASNAHYWIGINDEGQNAILTSTGNSHAHIVLRGGERHSNYDFESIDTALKILEKLELPPRLLIDCAHGNASRQHLKQMDVFQSVIEQIIQGNTYIRGLILESHLSEGNQAIENLPLQHGVSITDPCLGWASTEDLARWGREQLNANACNEVHLSFQTL